MKGLKVIDLFAGCGGLSLGFEKNGYQIETALEYDKMIAETYKKNHSSVNVIVDDIRNVDKSGIFFEKSADIIIGGPPCQGFSMAGARIRSGFMGDPRNYFFKHYFNVVKTVRPEVFIMENVKGIMTMESGDIFNEILKIFSSTDYLPEGTYKMWYKVVRAVDFGIPQKRERMIIVGIRNHRINLDLLWEKTICQIKSEVPSYFQPVTVYDAISNLPEPTEDGIINTPEPKTEYQKFLSTEEQVLTGHFKPNHSPKAIERMERVKSGENYTVLNEPIHSIHSGSYGRLSWNMPAPTITTRFDTPSGGRFIHPEKNRTLTPREAARIQSFPDNFVFTGSKSSICKQIGNAVPPKISYFLARLVRNIIEEESN